MNARIEQPADGIDRGTGLGAWLQRGVIGAGLWVLAVALLAVPLCGLGWWRPTLVWPLVVLAGVGIGVVVARVPAGRMARGPSLALVGVGLAAGWWAASTHSSQVLPRRDAGSNLQAAIALAETGHRLVSVPAVSIGGPSILEIPGVTLASPAFFEVGSSAAPAIQPQFVIGPAALYSLGHWIEGVGGALVMPPWFAALGILAIGLLVSLMAGGWWGPAAAGSCALIFPVLHTSRATYSEPLALLTLGAGFLAWLLAARFEDRRAGLLAGLLIGATCLVRIDGLREAILLLPVAALGIMQGRAWPRPLLLGTGLGVVLSFGAALALSNQYVGQIGPSLIPLGALGVLFGLLALALVVAHRRGMRMPGGLGRLLPGVLGLGTLLVGLSLAARPLFMTVRQDPADPGSRVVAGLQQRQGLPIDGGRTYAEQSVAWLSWYVGPVALVVALFALGLGLAHLGRRWTSGDALPAWTGPFVVAAGSTALTLWRPGITPDHPWADRRLIIALPFVAVLVVVAAARLWARGFRAVTRTEDAARQQAGLAEARQGGTPTALGRIAALMCVGALVVPATLATWPHRSERVERGSLSATGAVCHALSPGDVVIAIDSRAANEWPQVVRGMCGHPALSTTGGLRGDPVALRSALDAIATGVAKESGARLVLLAADSPAAITALGITNPPQASAVTVQEDDRLLVRRPDTLVPLTLDVWLAAYPRPAGE